MTLRMRSSMLSVTVGALLATSPAFAGAVVRHSGPIVSENTKRDTITIAEMGPWLGPKTRSARREFHLTRGTKVELAVRKNEPGARKGEFIERAEKVTDLRPGDYAIVTVDREGRRAVVTKVEVVRPGARADTPGPTPAASRA